MGSGERDVEKGYSTPEVVAKLRRLADALETGAPFRIQIAGERIRVPVRRSSRSSTSATPTRRRSSSSSSGRSTTRRSSPRTSRSSDTARRGPKRPSRAGDGGRTANPPAMEPSRHWGIE
jgi:hypothetical protein